MQERGRLWRPRVSKKKGVRKSWVRIRSVHLRADLSLLRLDAAGAGGIVGRARSARPDLCFFLSVLWHGATEAEGTHFAHAGNAANSVNVGELGAVDRAGVASAGTALLNRAHRVDALECTAARLETARLERRRAEVVAAVAVARSLRRGQDADLVTVGLGLASACEQGTCQRTRQQCGHWCALPTAHP